jgi:hypothetical protein
MPPEDYKIYQDNMVNIDLVLLDESGKRVVTTDFEDMSSSRDSHPFTTHHLADMIISGTHTLTLYLVIHGSILDEGCTFGSTLPTIQVTGSPTSSASTKTAGSVCYPDKISSDPEMATFQCPADFPCQPTTANTWGLWECQTPLGGIGSLINDTNYVRSLPPCAQWVDSGGNPITPQTAFDKISQGDLEKIWNDITGKASINIIKCASVMTAVGTISTDPASFITSVFTIVLGLAGGIALILIILAGYRYMTSQGNPEAVKAANEQLTAAIVGLLFIIFSFVILRTIGVDILKIPSFPIFSSGSGSSTTPGGTSGGSSSSSSTVCKGSCRHDCDDSADQTNTSDCRPPNRYCCVGE